MNSYPYKGAQRKADKEKRPEITAQIRRKYFSAPPFDKRKAHIPKAQNPKAEWFAANFSQRHRTLYQSKSVKAQKVQNPFRRKLLFAAFYFGEDFFVCFGVLFAWLQSFEVLLDTIEIVNATADL